MVAVHRAGLALLALALGCATTTRPAAEKTPAASRHEAHVRLAWMPFDAGASKELVTAVNARLERVKLSGVTESFQAPVSMEMAQLAIECIDKEVRCYSAVGQSIGADRLLWADLDRKPHGELTLRVTVFDVDHGAVVRATARSYPDSKAARADVETLVASAGSAR